MILQILSVQCFLHEGIKEPFSLFFGSIKHCLQNLRQSHQAKTDADGVHK